MKICNVQVVSVIKVEVRAFHGILTIMVCTVILDALAYIIKRTTDLI